MATAFFLDAIKFGNALDGLLGNGRALRLLNINEFTPNMRHAGNLRGFVLTEQTIEACIAVRMHPGFGILPSDGQDVHLCDQS